MGKKFSLAAVLVIAVLVTMPYRAEAGCHCDPHEYQGGWVVGYGGTCTDASANLATGARSEAQQDCWNLFFDGVCGDSYTPGPCTFDSSVGQWKIRADSISFNCMVCTGW